jgi:hypothetical protein
MFHSFRQLTIVVLTIFSALLITSCSSKHKAEKLDTELDKANPVMAGQEVGIKDDKMVVQRKALIAEELRKLQIDVHTLEDRTYGGPRYYGNPGLWGALNECRIRLANVATGGTGKLSYIEPREYVVEDKEFNKIGIDEKGQLVSLEEEFLKDRIERYQKYKKILMERNMSLQDKVDMCQVEFKAQSDRLSIERENSRR